ncbi:MAG: 4-(cytidine 5'-diphospho)-2-C-methyl-D-erythritol kinase [Gammaproteobacteria bacterium]|nr:MAG: 4-(cytidine 5'-diphospho)-2-C-methyl-D-erythritol kinase [Gammaproteobacteria bacterium]
MVSEVDLTPLGDTPRWPAPAKLNLFLHVTGRRGDGYHLLQTVFQFLDHGDELAFLPAEDEQICRQGSVPGVPEEDDLIIRAAHLLARHTGCRRGVTIAVRKRLPMGGGLGGGSSDAATVLVALNRLWGLDLSTEELARLGLELGADVPVFIHGQAAWAEGVGERLQPVQLPEPWYLVLRPPVSVSTATVFGHPRLTRNSAPITICDFLSGRGENVCEPVVRSLHPEVGEVLDWLGQHAPHPARMTGTGSCVFAAFEDRATARAVLEQAPAEWEGFVARGRNRSPLLDRLDLETASARG